MFFIMGITEGRKDFDFLQSILCSVCGRYGRYQVFMTYTVLSLFFIPCFKWNKHYYVRTTCCDTVYELDPEIGRRIARGENVEIREEDLYRVSGGGSGGFRTYKTCRNCGYTTDEDFQFCPKCGQEL
ncbi:MAG: zinc ribbon domain-containing protein [Lachnospiraceae bacterium]|nr:zinc ribbon domain-containing protein [Lachnospiraceae bacterium]